MSRNQDSEYSSRTHDDEKKRLGVGSFKTLTVTLQIVLKWRGSQKFMRAVLKGTMIEK